MGTTHQEFLNDQMGHTVVDFITVIPTFARDKGNSMVLAAAAPAPPDGGGDVPRAAAQRRQVPRRHLV